MTDEELLQVIQWAAREGVTCLDLSSQHLTGLPAEIGQLTKLTRLNLRSNRLTTLPAEIGQLADINVK